MQKNNNKNKIIISVLFIAMLSFFFVANFNLLFTICKDEVSSILDDNEQIIGKTEIENNLLNNFFEKNLFINLNGGIQKVLNKKIVNSSIRANQDMLFLRTDVDYHFDATSEKKNVDDIRTILKFGKKQGSRVIYVQHPFKYIEGETVLPYGMKIEINKQYDYYYDSIKASGIDAIDLRSIIKDKIEFYKTDHHWTIETSYYAAKAIDNRINENESNSKLLYNDNNYTMKRYRNSFLGSEGVRTGEYYVGKDDFVIPIPTFNTNFKYIQYVNSEKILEAKGDFSKAFLDEEILENNNYYNKFNACIYCGYVENVIINNNNNNKKLLLISDSFARPMVMYLSMAFHETRYLDPQEGRYNDSIISYIKKYKPDVIVMMYTGAIIEK